MCEIIITLENLLTLISHFNTGVEYSPSVLALCTLFRIPTDETVERGKPLSFITFFYQFLILTQSHDYFIQICTIIGNIFVLQCINTHILIKFPFELTAKQKKAKRILDLEEPLLKGNKHKFSKYF